MLKIDDLYPEIVINPISHGADELFVVTGYSSPEMCARVLKETEKSNIAIRIIVGMVSIDGVSSRTHERFVQTVSVARASGRTIDVQYIKVPYSVHAKMYAWTRKAKPYLAWIGSANFTQNGFGVGQRRGFHDEVMTQADPAEAIKYYEKLLSVSMSIDDSAIEEEFRGLIRNQTRMQNAVANAPPMGRSDSVTLPLIMLRPAGSRPRGEIHGGGAGLNWGMRGNRNANEAYIPVPTMVQNLKFFPARGKMFSVSTVDGEELVMRRAQDHGKALHTPVSNALLGSYFRRRLGVVPGKAVTLTDLERFGSRFVAFKKLDDENDEPRYLMEFSPRIEEWGVSLYRV